MNYIIYDLEFNQRDKKNENINLNFEIIQIGAVKLNSDFEVISVFNSLVKPTFFTTIHPYIEGLTKITNEELIHCPTFPIVFKNFLDFIGDNQSVLCIWGQADMKELIKNMEIHNIKSNCISNKYIDIQLYASKFFNAPSGSRIGLRNAIELINIPIKHSFHNALNDAIYTAEVFKRIYNKNIKIQEYKKSNPNNNKKKREKVNFPEVIKQFEKMYNRKLTDTEREMIKIAYFMGKTKQFLL